MTADQSVTLPVKVNATDLRKAAAWYFARSEPSTRVTARMTFTRRTRPTERRKELDDDLGFVFATALLAAGVTERRVLPIVEHEVATDESGTSLRLVVETQAES